MTPWLHIQDYSSQRSLGFLTSRGILYSHSLGAVYFWPVLTAGTLKCFQAPKQTASLSFSYQFTPIAWPRRSPCSGTLLPFPDLPCLLTARCSADCRLQQERISKAIFKWQQNKVLFGDASFLGNHVSCYSNTKGDLFAETSSNNATVPVGNRKTCSFEKKKKKEME